MTSEIFEFPWVTLHELGKDADRFTVMKLFRELFYCNFNQAKIYLETFPHYIDDETMLFKMEEIYDKFAAAGVIVSYHDTRGTVHSNIENYRGSKILSKFLWDFESLVRNDYYSICKGDKYSIPSFVDLVTLRDFDLEGAEIHLGIYTICSLNERDKNEFIKSFINQLKNHIAVVYEVNLEVKCEFYEKDSPDSNEERVIWKRQRLQFPTYY